jgi:RimJ/RimL family protein N-acetyltransferase
MPVTIQQITEYHIDGFREALGSVARERRWLLFTDTPEAKGTAAFVRYNIKHKIPQLVALDDSTTPPQVVGWCDVVPHQHTGTEHVGSLGMGVIESYRGQGIGTRLIEATLVRALARGMTRIELEVYSSNTRAIQLYEKFGFEREGTKRRARCVDDHWDDFVIMALLEEG